MKIFSFLSFLLTLTINSAFSAEKKTTTRPKTPEYSTYEIMGITLALPTDFFEVARAGNGERMVVFAVRSDVKKGKPEEIFAPATAIVRIKAVKHTPSYKLEDEIEKLEKEWKTFHDVTLLTHLSDIYKQKPLEKQNNQFSKGVGHTVSAMISNTKDFELMTYIAESKDTTLLLSFLSPGKKNAFYAPNRKAFELLAGSVP